MATRAVISGVYDTKIGSLPDSTCMSLHVEAALGAVEDAGLKLNDIDGLLTAYSFTSPQLMLGNALIEYLQFFPKTCASISMGGVTGGLLIAQACALVRSGMCRHVLCVTGDNRLTGLSDRVQAVLAGVGHPQYEQPYGMSVPAAFAQAADPQNTLYLDTKDGRVTIRLRPVAEGTELTLVHDRFADEATATRHRRGWTESLERLGARFDGA